MSLYDLMFADEFGCVRLSGSFRAWLAQVTWSWPSAARWATFGLLAAKPAQTTPTSGGCCSPTRAKNPRATLRRCSINRVGTIEESKDQSEHAFYLRQLRTSHLPGLCVLQALVGLCRNLIGWETADGQLPESGRRPTRNSSPPTTRRPIREPATTSSGAVGGTGEIIAEACRTPVRMCRATSRTVWRRSVVGKDATRLDHGG